METSDSLLCIQAIISSVFCNQLPFSCEAEHTVSHHVQKKLGHPFVTKTLKMYAGFTKKKKLLLRTENPPRSRSQVDIVLSADCNQRLPLWFVSGSNPFVPLSF